MQILNTYSKMRSSFSVSDAHPVFKSWGYRDSEIRNWFDSQSTQGMLAVAEQYLGEVQSIVDRVEKFFGRELPGELILIPSMGEVDGFARYENGHHSVMLGIDHPDASIEYLRALTAHELSHVYRDHAPGVWGFLGKPIQDVSREEYLEATSANEHLVSEGLATLTSQAVFPEVALHDHHYYFPTEMEWCIANDEKIHDALTKNLKSANPNPWRFYGENVVAKGAPSRTHYYWAAKRIGEWIAKTPGMTLVKAHGLHADQIPLDILAR